MTSGYNELFGGDAVKPSSETYAFINLTSNKTLSWPIEAVAGSDIVADLIDVLPIIPGGWDITLPAATGGSLGIAFIVNNLSNLYDFDVKDAAGNLLLTPEPGTVWLVYLVANDTAAGSWRTLQYGAQAGSINLAAIAGSGLLAIGSSLNQSMPVSSKNSDYVAVDGDRATVILWTGGAGNLTLPDPANVGSNWFINVHNAGSGALTVAGAAGSIDAAGNKVFAAGSSAIIFTDGANYYTVGYGGSGSVGGFNYTTIDVSGTGDYTISGAQLDKISYKLTGALTGNRNFIVPASVQQYWINNATTSTLGPWTLTVKTAAGTGQIVSQPGQSIVYCDGTNVVPAIAALALPLAVGSGGTGATTQGGARTNLGSTATGDALFTAASALAARNALGATTVGNALFIAASASAALTALAGGTLTGGLVVTGFLTGGALVVTGTTIPGATTVGMFKHAANELGFATNGIEAAYFGSDQHLNLTHALDISEGGTSATSVAGALAALGLAAMDDAASNSTIAQRTSLGRLYATYFNQSSALENPTIGATGGVFVENSAHDGYLRKQSMANFRTQFDVGQFSAATSGYQNFPSGITMQWGQSGFIAALGGTGAITFPVAFSSACYSVTITALGAGGPAQARDYVTGVSASGFTINNAAGASASVKFAWMAIGN